MTLERTAPIETHPLRLSDIPEPSAGSGELVIKVSACGVCRSNLHTIEGDWLESGVPSKFPIVPGHELCGSVAEIGEGVEGFSLGQRVGLQPLWSSCLRCEYCITSRENLCSARLITGENVDGGYAQYVLAKAQHTYHVPDAIDDVTAAPLFCPGVTAYRAVSKAGLSPGKRAAVFGMGGVGHMVLQFARLAGAEVVVAARHRRHRKLAENLGAARTFDRSDADAGEAIARDGGVDAAFVFAPSVDALREALAAIKPDGIVVNGAVNEAALRLDEEKRVVGSVIGSRQDMRRVLEIAGAGMIKVVTETFELENAEDALQRLKDGKIEARAVLVAK